MAWAVCINNTFAGVLGLTFPRMSTVMTPTGACKPYHFPLRPEMSANVIFSRLLRWPQSYRMGHDFLLPSRDETTHSRRIGS